MPLFGELSRSSQDSFESESDSKESRDDRLNSPKSGKTKKCLDVQVPLAVGTPTAQGETATELIVVT